ncbi:MAG: hypothetical protein O3A51_01705 [Verrucomicrobia bacterium]|nr:hypothetical protein [Verrucomicrobiota bacterium]
MHRNPDYIRSLSELEAVGRRGALDSFAAIYGLADQPRLILNGLYFEDHDQLEAFLAHQKNKKRRVVGFEKDTTDGFWLLVLACDPGLTYDTATINEIKQAAQRYRRRLGLTELFNNLDDDATGSSPSPPPDPTGSTPSNAPTD